MAIAHWQRPINGILGAKSGDRIGRNLRIQPHFLEKVARRQLQKRKGKQRDDEEEQGTLEKMNGEVAHRPLLRQPANYP